MTDHPSFLIELISATNTGSCFGIILLYDLFGLQQLGEGDTLP